MRAEAAILELDHNLAGQRLGRKGRDTRERILAAARRLLENRRGEVLSLTAIASEASVALTSLYRYFSDLGDLVIEALAPIRAEMQEIVAMVERPWPADEIYDYALEALQAHFFYWQRHCGALRLRNKMADDLDPRFVELRYEWSKPLWQALSEKFDHAHGIREDHAHRAMADIIFVTAERTATVEMHGIYDQVEDSLRAAGNGALAQAHIAAMARLIELGMKHGVGTPTPETN